LPEEGSRTGLRNILFWCLQKSIDDGQGTREEDCIKIHCVGRRYNFILLELIVRRPHWPRGLRRRSVTARLPEIVGSNATGGMDVCLL